MTTRNHQANALLENDYLNELFAECEAYIFKTWQQAQDDVKRSELWHEFQALGRIKKSIRARAQEELKQNAA